MQYNVKVLKYADNRQQVRVYSYLVEKDFHRDTIIHNDVDSDTTGGDDKSDLDNEEKEKHSVLVSKNRAINKIYELARSNLWDLFITLTFNPNRVNRYDYNDCIKATGDYFTYLKKYYDKDIVYLIVPEKHKDGAFHIHGLIGHADKIPLTRAKYKNEYLRDSKGRKIYNLPTYFYGFSTATKVDDNFAVCAYMTKYIVKSLDFECKHRKRYMTSWNIKKPVEVCLKLDRNGIDKLVSNNVNKCLFHKREEYTDSFIDYFEFKDLELKKIIEQYKFNEVKNV